MRRLWWSAALSLGMVSGASAQVWRGYTVTVPRPFQQCNLQARSSEDFITDGANQIVARRWQLEVMSMGASALVSAAVHRFFPSQTVRHSAKWSAAIGGLITGLVPHLRSQVIQRRFPIDVTHDAAEVMQRMVPYALTFTDDGSVSTRLTGYAAAAGLAVLGSCDAQY